MYVTINFAASGTALMFCSRAPPYSYIRVWREYCNVFSTYSHSEDHRLRRVTFSFIRLRLVESSEGSVKLVEVILFSSVNMVNPFEIVHEQDEVVDEEPFVLVEADAEEEESVDGYVLTSKSGNPTKKSVTLTQDTSREAFKHGNEDGSVFVDVPPSDLLDLNSNLKKRGLVILALVSCFVVLNIVEICYCYISPTVKTTHQQHGLFEDTFVESEQKKPQMKESESHWKFVDRREDMDDDEYYEIDAMIMHNVDFKQKYGTHEDDAQNQEFIELFTSSEPADVPSDDGSSRVEPVEPPEIKPKFVASRIVQQIPIPTGGSPRTPNDELIPRGSVEISALSIIRPVVVASNVEGAPLPSLALAWKTESVISTPFISSSVNIPSRGTAWADDVVEDLIPYSTMTNSVYPLQQIPVRSMIPFAAPKRSSIKGTAVRSGRELHLDPVPVPAMGHQDCIPTYNESGSSGHVWEEKNVASSLNGRNAVITDEVQEDRFAHIPTLVTFKSNNSRRTKRKRKVGRGRIEGGLVAVRDQVIVAEGRSLALAQYTFHEFLRQHDSVFVSFFHPCATYELLLAPLWTNFSAEVFINKLPLVTATVDCHSHPSLCRQQGIEKFITLRWFRNGAAVIPDFIEERTVSKLMKYSRTLLTEKHTAVVKNGVPSDTVIAAALAKDNAARTDHNRPSLAFVKKQRLSRNDIAVSSSTDVIKITTKTVGDDVMRPLAPANGILTPVKRGGMTKAISTAPDIAIDRTGQ